MEFRNRGHSKSDNGRAVGFRHAFGGMVGTFTGELLNQNVTSRVKATERRSRYGDAYESNTRTCFQCSLFSAMNV